MDELIEKLIALVDKRIERQEPQVYEIDLSKKYILILEDHLSLSRYEALRQQYEAWLESDEPILFLAGARGAKLVKVKTDE